MKKLFLIGGWIESIRKSIRSCCFYNIVRDNWTQIADLNEARDSAACKVLQIKPLLLKLGMLMMY